MKPGARQTKDNTAAFAKLLKELAGVRVMVGIPGDSAERVDDSGKVAPINNAALGLIMEHGSPAQNIPARPFLVPGVRDASSETTDKLKQAGASALAGNADAADRGFHAAGLIAQAAVKKKMSSGPFLKLSDSTLENRRRRGVTRTTPLIDTANLETHITYVVRRKK